MLVLLRKTLPRAADIFSGIMTQNLAPGPTVPPEYIGVWKRSLLRTPQLEDTTTQVYWMQTQSWHADIRVPAKRPTCADKSSLDQLTRDELLGLAKQQGFCGTTQVDGDLCRWLRKYDYQPPNGTNDIGRIEFDTPDRLLEYGVEADYFEIWERLPGSGGANSTLRLSAERFLFTAGSFFMIVRPRGHTLPSASDLVHLASGAGDAAFRPILDFEISFGHRAADTGQIVLSTLPWLQNSEILLAENPSARG